MTFWRLENLRDVTNGRWLVEPADGHSAAAAGGLSIDSRSLEPGQIFCALRGERVDGHDFLDQAQQNGAALLIVDRPEAVEMARPLRCPVLAVADALEALKALGAAYRRTLPGWVIGVTGSAGKTTTKGLIDAVLRSAWRGTVSPRSYNNAIGVPLTLLAAQPDDDYIVVEIGTNAPG